MQIAQAICVAAVARLKKHDRNVQLRGSCAEGFAIAQDMSTKMSTKMTLSDPSMPFTGAPLAADTWVEKGV